MLTKVIEKIMSLSVKETLKVVEPDVLMRSNNIDLVDLEKYAAARRHYRSKFETSLISGFVNYFDKKPNKNMAMVSVNHKSLSAKAVFDSVDKGHCFDTAYLKSDLTHEYSVYTDISRGSVLSQQDAIEWFENLAHTIPEAAAIVQGLRRLETKKEGSRVQESTVTKASASVMESVELRGVDLPETFGFNFVPTAGLPEHKELVRLRIRINANPMSVVLTPVGYDSVLEKIAEEFKTKLLDDLDHPNVFVGRIDFT